MSKYLVDLDIANENNVHTKILTSIKPNSVVLEFGPSVGVMTEYLQVALGCEVYIVELDEGDYSKAIKFAADGVCGDASKLEWLVKFADIKFDYILFADILEHLYDPKFVLQKSLSLLKPEGHVFISVPNIAHNSIIINLLQNKFEYKETGLLDSTHIRFFTYNSLLKMVDELGLVATVEDAIFKQPEESEFKNNYYALPGDTEIIENRNLGNAYQFVFQLVKKEHYSQNNHLIQINKKLEQQNTNLTHTAHIYIDSGYGFNEDEYITFSYSGTYIYKAVTLPPNATAIRLQLPDSHGCIVDGLTASTNNGSAKIYSQNGYTLGAYHLFLAEDAKFTIDLLPDTTAITLESTVFRYKNPFVFHLFSLAYANKQAHIDLLLGDVSNLNHDNNQLNQSNIDLQQTNAAIIQANTNLEQDNLELQQDNIAVNNSNIELQQTNSALYQHSENLDQRVKELRQHNLKLDKEIEELNQRLNESNNIIAQRDNDIGTIRATRTWRLAHRFARLSRRVFPLYSKRRLFAKMMIGFARSPFRFVSKLTPRRIGSFFRVMKTEGTVGVSTRMDFHMPKNAPPPSLQVTPVEQGVVKPINNYDILSFPQFDKPVVSILIPVYNAFEYTYTCLHSILANSGNVEYEIIIANDCSTDLTTEIESIVHNIKLVTQPTNQRFLMNCNLAAKFARGKYILFLNNDTQVQDNWLEPLVSLIEGDEKIGAVGSKLVYEGGQLQEAGGILWADGSAWNYGRMSDPSMPEYNYVKEADYISGAALMVRKSIWDKLGGFDQRFAPAYYEDTDICFAIRQLGYKVMLQPASVIVHFEGISNGTDLSEGQKKHQAENAIKFYDKWKDVLARDHFSNGENVFQARDRSRNKKTMLVIDHYVPHFDKDAGSRMMFQYLQLFLKHGFNVKFIGDNFYKHEPYTHVLEQMGIEVLYGAYYAKKWEDWLRTNGQYIDYVFLHRPHISVKYIDEINAHTNAKTLFCGADLHFLRELRAYEVTGDKSLLASSEKWKASEFELMRKVDTVYYLSPVEIDAIKEIDSSINAKLLTAFIFDTPKSHKIDFGRTKDIMFIGGFGHPPNVDAVQWYSQEVLPIIANARPDIKTYIIGSNPPEAILKLATDNLIITGFVTDEELAGYYSNCRLSIVPLRYGAGIKGKVIEAMYNRTPVVTTSVGAEGIHNADKCLFIKDSAEDFASEILRVYDDFDILAKAADRQAATVLKYYSMDAAFNSIKSDL